MALPAWALGLVKPVGEFISKIPDFVDDLHLSKEEKATLKSRMESELLSVQENLVENMLEFEKDVLEIQGSIIGAEIKGESWLQRNWRPLFMCLFGFIVAWNYVLDPIGTWVSGWFGGPAVPHLELPPQMWTLLITGIGGYIAGRSAEKIVKTVKGTGKSSNAE